MLRSLLEKYTDEDSQSAIEQEQSGAALDEIRLSSDRTILHLICEFDDTEVVERVLKDVKSRLSEEGFLRFIDYRDEIGYTAMHYAAEIGSVGVVQLLLNKGADLDGETDIDDAEIKKEDLLSVIESGDGDRLQALLMKLTESVSEENINDRAQILVDVDRQIRTIDDVAQSKLWQRGLFFKGFAQDVIAHEILLRAAQMADGINFKVKSGSKETSLQYMLKSFVPDRELTKGCDIPPASKDLFNILIEGVWFGDQSMLISKDYIAVLQTALKVGDEGLFDKLFKKSIGRLTVGQFQGLIKTITNPDNNAWSDESRGFDRNELLFRLLFNLSDCYDQEFFIEVIDGVVGRSIIAPELLSELLNMYSVDGDFESYRADGAAGNHFEFEDQAIVAQYKSELSSVAKLSPLGLLILNDKIKAIKYLSDKIAVEIKTDGIHPLIMALKGVANETMKYLLDDCKMKPAEIVNPKHLALNCSADVLRYADAIKDIRAKGIKVSVVNDAHPLLVACVIATPEVVGALVKNYSKIKFDNIKGDLKDSVLLKALCIAIQSDRMDKVDAFLSNKKGINLATKVDNHNALELIAKYGNTAMMESALRYAQGDGISEEVKFEVLRISAAKGYIDSVNLLLEQGALPVYSDDSAFTATTRYGHIEVMEKLQQKQPDIASIADKKGNLPIIVAINSGGTSGGTDVVEKVIAMGAKMEDIDQDVFSGCLVNLTGKEFGHQMLEYLLEKELLDCNKDIVIHSYGDGGGADKKVSLLQIAISYGKEEVVNLLMQQPGIKITEGAIEAAKSSGNESIMAKLGIESERKTSGFIPLPNLEQEAGDVGMSQEEYMQNERRKASVSREKPGLKLEMISTSGVAPASAAEVPAPVVTPTAESVVGSHIGAKTQNER